MSNLSKTQIAILTSATEGTLDILPRDENGYVDYAAPRTSVSGLVVKGHRNGMAGLKKAGLVRKDTAGADNIGMLTEAGIAAAQAL